MNKTASQIADIVLHKLASQEGLVNLKEDLPWLTSAAGGTLGAVAGSKLLKKKPIIGAAVGAMAGTIPGLYTGKYLGRQIPYNKQYNT